MSESVPASPPSLPAGGVLGADATDPEDVALLVWLVNLITWQLIASLSGPPVQAAVVRIGLVVNTVIILLIVGLGPGQVSG